MTRKNHIKIESLKRQNDISKVLKLGKRKSFDGITIAIVKNTLTMNRLLIIPSHGFGNAVERNTLKRRVRYIFSHLSTSMKSGFDIAVIIKKTEKNTTYQDLLIKIERVLIYLHLLSSGEKENL